MNEEVTSFLLQAIRLAEENVRQGGGPFGAVVVKQGHVVGRGVNRVTTNLDPTAHAEVMAIRDACQNLGSFQLQGCELYTSCEPCPMCLGAIYWARPEAVYFAANQNDAAMAGFDDAFIYREIELPCEQRRIPMKQACQHLAHLPFEAWQALQEKTQY